MSASTSPSPPDTGRRRLLRGSMMALAATLSGSLWRPGFAQVGTVMAPGHLGRPGELGAPDDNGIRLPAGFRSRVVARAGTRAVDNSPYRWHKFPDGGATFSATDGGWIYVSNSEIPLIGGAGALRFAADSTVVDRRRGRGRCRPWGSHSHTLPVSSSSQDSQVPQGVGPPAQFRLVPANMG